MRWCWLLDGTHDSVARPRHMTPLRRHPSAASSLAKALNNDPKRISLFITGILLIGGMLWWYDRELAGAADFETLRRLVLGGRATSCVAALALAAALWRLGGAAVRQQNFPPASRLVPLLLILPGDARLSGREATRRGRMLMGLACGLCVWALIVFLLVRYIDGAA